MQQEKIQTIKHPILFYVNAQKIILLSEALQKDKWVMKTRGQLELEKWCFKFFYFYMSLGDYEFP